MLPLPSVHVGDRALQEMLSDHTVAVPASSGLRPVTEYGDAPPVQVALGHDKGIKAVLGTATQGFQRSPSKLEGGPDRRDPSLHHLADLEGPASVFSLSHFMGLEEENR